MEGRRAARRHRAPGVRPERGHLLTLRRLLDTLVDTRQEVVTLIETKHPTRHGSDVEKTLVQVLRAFDLADGDQPGRPHVRMMSFSNRALQRMHKLAPRLPLVYLVDATMPALTWDGILPKGVHAVGLDVRMLRKPKASRPSSAAATRSTCGPSTTTTTSTAASIWGRRHHHQPPRPRASSRGRSG